jgi:AcrR family transcriptional regulator
MRIQLRYHRCVSASRSTPTQRPSGRGQVTSALLSATEGLCALGQPSSFTVTDIAREANVTTSLLYFYFTSKDDLVVQTLRSIASDMDARAAEAASPAEMAVNVSNALKDRPAFARIIAWFVLEDRSITREIGDQPFLRRLTTTLAADESNDPHTEAGAVVAVLLSAAFFAGSINTALGRDSEDERLAEALDELTARALSPRL